MKETFLFKAVGGSAVALASFLWGGMDNALTTLLFFVVMDFITGTLVALKFRNLSREKSFHGFTKKIVLLLMVAVAVRVDVMTGANGAVRLLAIYGYIGNEFYSIVENAIKLDVPIPESIGKYFEAYLAKKGSPGRRSSDYER